MSEESEPDAVGHGQVPDESSAGHSAQPQPEGGASLLTSEDGNTSSISTDFTAYQSPEIWVVGGQIVDPKFVVQHRSNGWNIWWVSIEILIRGTSHTQQKLVGDNKWHNVDWDIPNSTGPATLTAKISGSFSETVVEIFVSPRPSIDNSYVFNNVITGSGGQDSNLKIQNPDGSLTYSPVFFAPGNRWLTSLPQRHPGVLNIVVAQNVAGIDLIRKSVEKEILYLSAPKFNLVNNQVVKLDTTVAVNGTWGASGQKIQVMNETGGINYGEDNAILNGSWGIAFAAKAHFPNGGSAVLNARHALSGDEAWTRLNLFLLAPPTLNTPVSVVDMNTRITGTGHTGISGHSIDVFRDALIEKIGGGWVNQTTGAWSVDVSLPAGRIGVTASQLYSGVESVRAAPVYFNVRPPRLGTIAVSYEGDKTILSGARHNDTRVQIYKNGDETNAHFTVPVGRGNWRVEVPASYLPGHYIYDRKQSISDGGSGWIDSEWSVAQSVEVKPRKLTLNTPSLNGQKPTFTGTGGYVWVSGDRQTIVEIRLNGQYVEALVPQQYLSANGTWTIAAVSNLPPGSYTITVRQLVNSVWSEQTELTSPLLIKPDQTLFTEPLAPTGQLPRISLAAWPMAMVRLTDNQNVLIKEHAADVTSGIWHHSADKTWDPGSHTVKATQTFGGLTSVPATHTFTVNTPVALITPPLNNEVSPRPVITGINAWPHSWVVIYSAVGNRPELGRGEVKLDGTWSAPLAKQSLGPLLIFAVQVFNTQSSADGARLDLSVVVPVPKFAPIPPKPGRTFNLTGTGFVGATVEVLRKGVPTPLAKDIEVRPNGTWTVQLTLEVGPVTLVAIHRYESQFTSLESEDLHLTVVSNLPVIETPAENEWTSSQPVFSGFGFPGDMVNVARPTDERILATAQVSVEGTWSKRCEVPLSPDSGNVYAIQALQFSGNYNSGWTVARNFRLSTPPPVIRRPATDDWVGLKPVFSGTAPKNAAVTVSAGFNPDEVLAECMADGLGNWEEVSRKNLPEGAYWVQVRTTVNEVSSEWIESGQFWVKDGTRLKT